MTIIPYDFSVEHSGKIWKSLGWHVELGVPVWPIEEYLARTKHGKSVAERIARLNPDGKPEGERPHGLAKEL